MSELMETKQFVPMREGPFRTCIQLPQTRPKEESELPKLYEDLRIDLKEADSANRRHRITIRKAGVILGVLAIYLLLAAMIFPRTRFFRRPITVVWGASAVTQIEPRTLDRLPQEIRDALGEGRFTHARDILESTFFEGELLPRSDHFAWPFFLLTLERTQDPRLIEMTNHLLGENPEMLEARFYRALYFIKNTERSRLNPAWYDGRTKKFIEETNENLQTALSDLERVTQALVPLDNRRTPAQSERLRLCYHHIAEANYLLWLHDPDRPKTATPHLVQSFRHLDLADPDRAQAESVRLRKQMARSFEELLAWGMGNRRKHDLFEESRDLANLRKYMDDLRNDYDRARRLQ